MQPRYLTNTETTASGNRLETYQRSGRTASYSSVVNHEVEEEIYSTDINIFALDYQLINSSRKEKEDYYSIELFYHRNLSKVLEVGLYAQNRLKILSNITKEEGKLLAEFLDSRMNTMTLCNGTFFRGIQQIFCSRSHSVAVVCDKMLNSSRFPSMYRFRTLVSLNLPNKRFEEIVNNKILSAVTYLPGLKSFGSSCKTEEELINHEVSFKIIIKGGVCRSLHDNLLQILHYTWRQELVVTEVIALKSLIEARFIFHRLCQLNRGTAIETIKLQFLVSTNMNKTLMTFAR